MVKSVVGEETQMRSAEDRLFQSPIPAQVGLAIGKLSPGLDRGFVYDLVPTPPTDGGRPACSFPLDTSDGDKKKTSKGGGRSTVEAPPPSLVVDGDWVAEHARQVSRMLLGGMHVVGVYVWASDASFKTSTSILCQTISRVARAAPFFESDLDERLLIHISYSPRRWSCRNCTLASSNALPRRCDFKMGKLLASLQTFRCVYNFEMRLPICHDEAFKANMFRDVVRNGITCHAKELKSMKALIGGNMVSEDSQCTSEGVHEVELLLPFMKDAPAETCSLEEVVGFVVFSGTIGAFAYLGPKEHISQAISDIKGDIITSLQSRLDIICDAAEGEVESSVNSSGEASKDLSDEKSSHQLILHELRKPCSLSFPRRVLVPWLASVSICDYLQPSETFEDLKDHCKEMMSFEADEKAILELEEEATSMIVQSFWDVVLRNPASPVDCSKNVNCSAGNEGVAKLKNRNFNILIAIAILLLSIVLGWGIANLGPIKIFH